MKLLKTIYNIITHSRTYETPTAHWRYYVGEGRIVQTCKKDNMKRRNIEYRLGDNKTYLTHIERVRRQSHWIARV
jgi:hypothetical protein